MSVHFNFLRLLIPTQRVAKYVRWEDNGAVTHDLLRLGYDVSVLIKTCFVLCGTKNAFRMFRIVLRRLHLFSLAKIVERVGVVCIPKSLGLSFGRGTIIFFVFARILSRFEIYHSCFNLFCSPPLTYL